MDSVSNKVNKVSIHLEMQAFHVTLPTMQFYRPRESTVLLNPGQMLQNIVWLGQSLCVTAHSSPQNTHTHTHTQQQQQT